MAGFLYSGRRNILGQVIFSAYHEYLNRKPFRFREAFLLGYNMRSTLFAYLFIPNAHFPLGTYLNLPTNCNIIYAPSQFKNLRLRISIPFLGFVRKFLPIRVENQMRLKKYYMK